MSATTGIEWTDATWTDERGMQRTYVRKVSTRPGQQERRKHAAIGERWCRGCQDWLPTAQVRDGACRPCLNREYRAQYATNPHDIRARVHARKRSIAPLPALAAEYLTEQFEGRCAYCTAAATTWDHVVPVIRGGETTPANVVPACVSCNSSKKDSEVWSWLAATGRTPSSVLFDVLILEVA